MFLIYCYICIVLYCFPFYRTCKENPEEKIAVLVAEMSEEFCRLYTQSTEDYNGPSMDFAKMRLQMGQILYYTFLEHILMDEKRRGVDLMVSHLIIFAVIVISTTKLVSLVMPYIQWIPDVGKGYVQLPETVMACCQMSFVHTAATPNIYIISK